MPSWLGILKQRKTSKLFLERWAKKVKVCFRYLGLIFCVCVTMHVTKSNISSQIHIRSSRVNGNAYRDISFHNVNEGRERSVNG